MFFRSDIDLTLPALLESVSGRDENTNITRVEPGDFEFHLDAPDPCFRFGDIEIEATETSMASVGNYLSVPSAFMNRMVENASGTTLNALFGDLLSHTVRKDMAIRMGVENTVITEISAYGSHDGIKPYQVVDKIIPVFEGLPEEYQPRIARLVDEKHHFAFDAYCPFDAGTFGIGGDFALDDLTAAGVRVDINLKQGLTPTVQPFTFRRACTNGMEQAMTSLKIEGRGQTVDEVLAELEEMARLAFSQAEKDISNFYELRETKVENPERLLVQMSRERGIPARSATAILELAAGEDLPDEPSMFDVINLVTNFANSPTIRNDGGRLLLERAGGAVASEHTSRGHAARCGHCTQKVSS